MTGKLLGPSTGEKPKEPEGGSSDDEHKAMLSEEHKYMDEEIDPREKWCKGWAALMYFKPLPLWFPERVVLCLLAHFGFTMLYIIRSAMSVAVVRMTTPYAILEDDHLVSRVDFDWSSKEKGLVLSSFFIGYIFTQIPGGYLAMKWGGRKVFGIGVFFASVTSLLTPLLGHMFGFYGLIIARILCGLSEGVTYPAIHAMWNHWAPPKERTTLVSFAFSGAYIGSAITMGQYVHAGNMVTKWDDSFYMPAAIAIIWAIFWFSWGAEYPELDPLVSKQELKLLAETVGFPRADRNSPVPWLKILLSQRVWAISICHFAANWGFYTILTELPTFLSQALHLEGAQLKMFSLLPFVAMAISALLGGMVVDLTLHRWMNTTNTRKVTVAVTFIAQMMLFFLTGKATEGYESAWYIIGALFFCGLCWSGFSANHLDIAPDYAGILLGVTNTFGTLPGIISPIITGVLVKDESDVASWSTVFLITGYIYLVAAVFYIIFGGGERQDWADASEGVKLNSVKKQSNNSDVETASD